MASVIKKAYDSKKPDEELSQAFVNSFNERFTQSCQEGDQDCGSANLDPSKIKVLERKKSRK